VVWIVAPAASAGGAERSLGCFEIGDVEWFRLDWGEGEGFGKRETAVFPEVGKWIWFSTMLCGDFCTYLRLWCEIRFGFGFWGSFKNPLLSVWDNH